MKPRRSNALLLTITLTTLAILPLCHAQSLPTSLNSSIELVRAGEQADRVQRRNGPSLHTAPIASSAEIASCGTSLIVAELLTDKDFHLAGELQTLKLTDSLRSERILSTKHRGKAARLASVTQLLNAGTKDPHMTTKFTEPRAPYPTFDQFWRAYQNHERPADLTARENQWRSEGSGK
jgi:hypothetical protein